MAYLKVVEGPNTGQIWELREPKTVLGRHPDCQIPIDQPDVSRHHAQLTSAADGWLVEDLNSLNGTLLNDSPVRRQQRVRDGDRIRIRNGVFKFYQGPFLESPAGDGEAGRRRAAVRSVHDNLAQYLEPTLLGIGSDGEGAALQSQLRALLQISQALRQRLGLDAVLPQILQSLFTIFSVADQGLIALRDEQGGIVPRWVKLREGGDDQDVCLSRTVAQQVMESQEAVLSADASHDERFGVSDSLGALPAHSLMCAPLIDGEGRSFGVLQLDALSGRGYFGEGDLELFLSVAAQASIAIENARFYERTVRERALAQEWEVADQIRRGCLPRHRPQLPGWEFFDFYEPAQCAGSACYDYISLPDGRLAIAAANVQGPRLAAAMWMAKLGAELRLQLLTASGPLEALQRLNRTLVDDALPELFVTLLLAVLHPESGEVRVVNAGYAPPLLCPADGRIEEVFPEQSQLPLGVMEGAVYEEFTLRLTPGATLAICSDGLCEATNAAHEAYGVARLRSQLQLTLESVAQRGQWIVEDLQRFLDGEPLGADLCLLLFGWKPGAEIGPG